ncbi:unnamed protein product [Lactuca virosa]|uniref:Uncharacterized protein n=1 Tax=Lactuca virosa TaxID=75947 RepID=A0AAU9NC70_9ASTR|nr:unnamed protein product [Lactuca virosa]
MLYFHFLEYYISVHHQDFQTTIYRRRTATYCRGAPPTVVGAPPLRIFVKFRREPPPIVSSLPKPTPSATHLPSPERYLSGNYLVASFSSPFRSRFLSLDLVSSTSMSHRI